MKKILIWMICAVLAASNAFSFPIYAEETADESVEAMAEEVADEAEEEAKEAAEEAEEKAEEPTEEPEEKVEEPAEEPEEKAGTRKMKADRSNISFGTITEGDSAEPEEFSIVNNGDVPLYLHWNQADSNGAFEISALSDAGSELEPGDSMDFQVRLNDLSVGDYTASIVFEDEDDPPVEATVSLSVKVKEAEVPEETEPEESQDQAEFDEDSQDAGTDAADQTQAYYLETLCEPEEGGVAVGDGLYSESVNALLIAFENDGYHFDGWYLDGSMVTEDTDLTVSDIHSDLSYTARFSRKAYKIKVTAKNGKYGNVSGGGSFKKGEDTVISASPEEGVQFEGWYEDGALVSKESNYTVSDIDSDHTFTAVFKPEKHTVKVSVSPKAAGTVTGSGKYEHGAKSVLEAKPAKGYVFKGYAINNNIISENEKFTLKEIDRDVSVTAYFTKEKEKSYVITSGIANKGGSISPSGKVTIGGKGSITYTFAPDNGYVVQEVSVDGKKQGALKSYTFKNIKEDHKISVAFAPKKGNEKGVSKDPIITEAEAEKIAVATLKPAGEDSEGRYSDIITPEDYARMKKEGTLEDALSIPDQNIVGMDDADGLPDEVEDYNYDEAKGLYQILDITPEEARKMIREGDDDRIIRGAYEAGYLIIRINNQFLVPGKEEEITDIFEDDRTVKNMLEFVSGLLSEDDELVLMDGKKMAVTFGITSGDDLSDEEKDQLEKAGARISEYFRMTVTKQRKGEKSQPVTELNKPVEVVLSCPEGSDTDCIVRLHDGSAELLPDLDDDPATITIQTDKFSPYAFASKEGAKGKGLPIAVGAAAVILIGAIAVIVSRKRRKVS